MKSAKFAVDAYLLQELGERLVARAHIALGELIKNAYDADANTCRVEFGEDSIVVSDDGIGMSERDFLDHWMRLGTTHKVDKRTSPAGRPLTGSKGIGRLSVQFLANRMMLESSSSLKPGTTLRAWVDWSTVVRGQDLSTVAVEWTTEANVAKYPRGHPTGTRIVLTDLKNQWDAESLEDLGREVWQLRSPFKARAKRARRPEDFDIEIEAPLVEGAQEAFNLVWDALFSNWKARIRGSLDRGRSGQRATIAVEFREGYPAGAKEASVYRESVPVPVSPEEDDESPLIDRTSFEILIFRPIGRQPAGIPVAELRKYLATYGNVSVYDSGFRLPYYGSGRDAAGQDWLNIAVDQGRRLNQSELLPEHLRTQNRYMQDLPAPGRIFGAVDIDTNHERNAAKQLAASPGEWLQIQSGRDRLHDNAAFSQLRDLVRFSLDFYANRHRLRAVKAEEQRRAKEPPSEKYDRVVRSLDAAKERIPQSLYKDVRRELISARKAARVEEKALDRRAALLAPLASAGVMALALNHEMARETRLLSRVSSQLRKISDENGLPELEALATEFTDANQRLQSLRSLFGQLADQEAETRPRVRTVLEEVVDAMRVLTPGVEYHYANVPGSVRFPVGTTAEWSAVLQNVVANAWNAMLECSHAEVAFTAGRSANGREWLRVSDTGVGLGVPLDSADVLFEPFERRMKIESEKRSIAIGGQGLGLAIVRMIARRRGADVEFVQPSDDYSTAIEFSWKGSRG